MERESELWESSGGDGGGGRGEQLQRHLLHGVRLLAAGKNSSFFLGLWRGVGSDEAKTEEIPKWRGGKAVGFERRGRR